MRYRSTEQTVAWFSRRVAEDSLVLRPPFQRRPVWSAKQKSNLIESALLKLPIPEIYMTSTTTPDGAEIFEVVDGQQRITSILEFLGAGNFHPLELTGLRVESPWHSATFDTLSDQERADFYSYPLAVRLLSEVEYGQIVDLFVRFNKYLTPLNPQELRHAMYGGEFTRLTEDLADDSYWAENQIVDTKSIRRMKDIEFASDLLIGTMHGPQSGSPGVLDEYYERYEVDESGPDLARAKRLFNRTLNMVQLMLPDIKGTRWRNRTDFYSLFVAVAHRVEHDKLESITVRLRDVLDKFSDEIEAARQAEAPDQPLAGSPHVVAYIEAVRRGSSDRGRRAARHKVLVEILQQVVAGAG